MRPDRALAIAAFLAAVTALWLPWWGVAIDDGTTEGRDDVRAFRPEPPLTTAFGPWLTGLLAAAAVVLLFVRVAGDSHAHEPASWRRDLLVAAGLLAAAALSCLLWPADVPSFWGGRTYDAGGVRNVETALPGLGWWLAWAAALLSAGAWWKARKTPGTTAK
jgi:hypothetical protein